MNQYGDPKEFAQLASDISSIADGLRNTIRQSSETEKIIRDTASAYRSISRELSMITNNTKDLLRLNNKVKALRKEQVKIEVQRVILMERAKHATAAELSIIYEKLDALIDTEEHIKATAGYVQSMSNDLQKSAASAKQFKGLADSIRRIPGIGPLLSKPLQDAADTVATSGSRIQGFFKFLTSSIGLLSGPALIKGLLEISKQVKDLRISLGISSEASRSIRADFAEFAESSKNGRVNVDALVEAQLKLNQIQGLGVKYSERTLESYIDLTKGLGVAEEAASKVLLIQQSLGDSSGDYAWNLATAAKEAGNTLGVNVSSKEVFESINKLSATTLINLRRNPQAIGQALVEAKKLGMELESIRGVSESILNWEQSIQNELEAEVLTGRELNLERARLAALRGDDLTLAKELRNQVGSISEFEQMNVIQRESLAKAFGLNVNQMSEMLIKQEAINANASIANKLSKESLQNAYKISRERGISLSQALREVETQQDATEGFQNSVTNLTNSLREFFVQLEPILTSVANALSVLVKNPILKGAALIAAGGATIISILKNLSIIPQRVFVVNNAGGGIGGFGGKGFKGRLLRGGAAGLVGAGLGMGLDYMAGEAEAAGDSGLSSGLNYASAAANYGGIGAFVGSVVPGIGTAVGAGVGAGVGLLLEYLKQTRDEDKQEKAQEKQNSMDMVTYLRELSQQSAAIYMDGNQVGLATVQSAYRLP